MKASCDRTVVLYSTCPPAAESAGAEYAHEVAEAARWSERHGCTGILVYSDNRMLDPWLVSQIIIEHTERLAPLVAVQPVYMHPYAVAKKLASFGHAYGRRVDLNMVAGGFRNDLLALNDPTPHDRRYDRLREYTTIIRQLLEGEGPVSFAGEFYAVTKLRMTPPLDASLFPGILVSASSEAGRAAARAVGATAVKYPRPPGEEEELGPADSREGIRVGIIAREEEREAWAVARLRFPEDRKGQLTQQLAMKVSDSVWHRQLSELARNTEPGQSPYWLVPFENYRSMCPYLVGSYDRVANELARYIGLGYRAFILDVPPAEEELRHTRVAFDRALELAEARV